jgi:hypothetical protein
MASALTRLDSKYGLADLVPRVGGQHRKKNERIFELQKLLETGEPGWDRTIDTAIDAFRWWRRRRLAAL